MKLGSERGQSLVGTLVGVGILGVIVMVMTSIFSSQHRELKGLQERLAVLDSNRILSEVMASGVCTFMVSNAGPWLPSGVTLPLNFDRSVVNTSTSPNLRLQQILAQANATAPAVIQVGQAPVSSAPSATVESIEITNITGDPNGDQFLAELQVKFNAGDMVRPLKPVTLKIPLTTTTSGSTKNITACDAASSAGSGESIILQHQTAAGVQGDNIGTAWTKKTLNTLQYSNIVGANLSNSEVSLPAGSYHIQASLSVRGDGGEQVRSRLLNVTSGATICYGSGIRFPGSDEDTVESTISCGFTLNGPEIVRLEMISRVGNAVAGFASWASPAGSREVHASVAIRKL